jgi:hypothetical protein
MEGMRAVVQTGVFSWPHFAWALGLNGVYALLCIAFYVRMLDRGRENGQLVRMTG